MVAASPSYELEMSSRVVVELALLAHVVEERRWLRAQRALRPTVSMPSPARADVSDGAKKLTEGFHSVKDSTTLRQAWAGRTCTDVLDLLVAGRAARSPTRRRSPPTPSRLLQRDDPLTCADVATSFSSTSAPVPLDTPIPAVDVRALRRPSPPPPSWPSPADPPPPSLPPPSPSPAPPSPPDARPTTPPLLSLRCFNLYWDHHNTENMKVYMPCMIANVNEVANTTPPT